MIKLLKLWHVLHTWDTWYNYGTRYVANGVPFYEIWRRKCAVCYKTQTKRQYL